MLDILGVLLMAVCCLMFLPFIIAIVVIMAVIVAEVLVGVLITLVSAIVWPVKTIGNAAWFKRLRIWWVTPI